MAEPGRALTELIAAVLAAALGSVVHEAAHALAGTILRLRIVSIRVGTGPAARLGRLRLGPIPWGGEVRFDGPVRGGLRRLLVFGAGPAASLLACSAVVWLGGPGGGAGTAAVVLAVQGAISLLPTAGSDLHQILHPDSSADLPPDAGQGPGLPKRNEFP